MRKLVFIINLLIAVSSIAQYAPAAEQIGTTAINKDSSIIVAWATSYKDYIIGSDVDTTWQHPEKALGVAEGLSGEIVSLGRGGEITLGFDRNIVNGDGADFATFENGFNDTFLELAWVEVSQDGIVFYRFPNYSLTTEPVYAFGNIEPTNITGYCSKYRAGFGTPFDLEDLGLDYIKFVKIIDIIGDSSATDSDGNYIFDPYPTTGSAGVDIDAIAVINQEKTQSANNYNLHEIKVFPNPAKNFLNIYNLQNTNKIIEIIDISGNRVKLIKNTGNDCKIDIKSLQKGIYFIYLDAQIIKFVKI